MASNRGAAYTNGWPLYIKGKNMLMYVRFLLTDNYVMSYNKLYRRETRDKKPNSSRNTRNTSPQATALTWGAANSKKAKATRGSAPVRNNR